MLIGAAAAMLAFGVGYHMELSPSGEADEAGLEAAPGTIDSYRLFITGNSVACRVTKGRKLSAQVAEIKLSHGCGEAYDRLTEAALWREGSDGEIAFATKDGRTLVRFTAGDGVAYESYRPTVPFLSLVAEK